MKVNDKVVLIEEIDTANMFPLFLTEADLKLEAAGKEGFIEELYKSGGGIVNFNGHRVMFFDLSKKVRVV